MNWKTIVVAFMVCRFMCATLLAQQEAYDSLPGHLQEMGLPFIQNYSKEDYKGDNQVWDAVQDSRGVMYFANSRYILIYDGVRWKSISSPNGGAFKSLAIDSNDTVYIGGTGDLGYLKADELGILHYISLLPLLQDGNLAPKTIWDVHATSQGVFYNGNDALFIYRDGKLVVKKFEDNQLFVSKQLSDTIYLSIKNRGLMSIVEDGPKLLSKGEKFAELKIHTICPWDDGGLLIGTYENGLFLFQNGIMEPFVTKADAFLKANQLYSGIRLTNGDYALGTLKGGLLIIDKMGGVRFHLKSKDELPSISVLNVYQDHSNNLWVTTNGGISRIEYPSPFTIFDRKLGLTAPVNEIVRYNGSLFAGTYEGLYKFNFEKETENFGLTNYLGIQEKVWDLQVFEDELLVGLNTATYQIKKDVFSKINDKSPSEFIRSKINKNRVYVPADGGLFSLLYLKGSWVDEGFINGIDGSTYDLVEEDNGNLWVNPNRDFVWHVQFENRDLASERKIHKIQKLGHENGLPKDYLYLNKKDGKIFMSAFESKKSFGFDKSKNLFVQDKSLTKVLNESGDSLQILHISDEGSVWYKSYSKEISSKFMVAEKLGENNYKINNLFEERISEFVDRDRFVEDSIVWHYWDKPIVARHDLRFKNNIKPNRANIGTITYKEDSVIYGGHKTNENILVPTSMPFKDNRLRFGYSLPSDYSIETSYQVILEGHSPKWSNWSSETQKDYTNIPEGDYTFKVRAKNIYGQVSKEDSYSFTILPPWYRTWWAYLIYAVFAGLLLWLFSQWRSQQLRKKNLALEALVDERTHEVQEKNKQLSYQTEKLKEMDTMKTRLFANISHEFRTPLTLIKGPIEKLEQEQKTTISMPNIKMIRRNANRLLNLVNQLLDLSKLDSGKLKLNEAEGDVLKCIRAAASAFSSHAASRQMDYQIKIPSRLLWAAFDRDKLEKIIYNLLSNAFKFTEDEGRVVIETEFRSGRLRIKVSDTGKGISADKLPHIFDRFFQVDDSYTKEKSGSGIGLALTKELVELMGGTIYVESSEHKGTSFRVVVPLEEIKSGHVQETEETEVVQRLEEPVYPTLETEEDKEIKILIIEDNNDMRHFIREQLEQDYHVLEARNGKEGLAVAQKMVPDLIVSDLMMPQMDGITLCKKLKTDIATSHIPVIMLTAKAGIENKLEGLETGADDYLTKPFNAKELQIRTKNLIEQRQQLRELFSRNISLDPKEITVNSLDEEFLNSLLALFEEKFADSAFGVPQMQKQLGMSKTALHAKVRALTNHPPGELLRNFRLKRAAQFLTQKGDNISQTAYDVGFNSLSYFTRCFKEYYGSSPSEFVKKNDSEA